MTKTPVKFQNRRSPCVNVMHARFPAMAILHPYGSKNFWKIVHVLVHVQDPVKPASACTSYINQDKPKYVPFTLYRPCRSPGKLPRGLLRVQNHRRLCMLSFQSLLYCGFMDLKFFEKSCGPSWHALRLPTGSHVLALTGPVNCPGASCDIGVSVVLTLA